jgi:tRNA(fMet)-specific endonuclease VapC
MKNCLILAKGFYHWMKSTWIPTTEAGMDSLQFLLDTNILSHLVRNPQGVVRDHIARVGEQTVCTSLLVAAELRFGAERKRSGRLQRQVEVVLAVLPILPIEVPVDVHYAQIRATLETAGQPIGPNDLIAAAHARACDLVLVTHNESEFSRVPGLRVENWLR